MENIATVEDHNLNFCCGGTLYSLAGFPSLAPSDVGRINVPTMYTVFFVTSVSVILGTRYQKLTIIANNSL